MEDIPCVFLTNNAPLFTSLLTLGTDIFLAGEETRDLIGSTYSLLAFYNQLIQLIKLADNRLPLSEILAWFLLG